MERVNKGHHGDHTIFVSMVTLTNGKDPSISFYLKFQKSFFSSD